MVTPQGAASENTPMYDPLNQAEQDYCAEYGRQARNLYPEDTWTQIEARLEPGWTHSLTWSDACESVRDGWIKERDREQEE